jgi:hypothetical protein
VHEYVAHYHSERNYEGKSNVLLFPRITETRGEGPVRCRERLSGQLRYYHQGARLNWRVRSADDREAAIRRLSCGCHVKLTVGKFASGTVDQTVIDAIERTFKSQSMSSDRC